MPKARRAPRGRRRRHAAATSFARSSTRSRAAAAARDGGCARRLGGEEALDGVGRLVERVPEHRVPRGDPVDLEQVAERGPVRVEQVRRTGDTTSRRARAASGRGRARTAAARGSSRRRRRRPRSGSSGSASGRRRPRRGARAAPPRRARAARVVRHALLVAAVDPLVERGVRAVAAGVLGRAQTRRAAGARSPGRAGRAARRAPARPRRPRRRSGRRRSARATRSAPSGASLEHVGDVLLEVPRRLPGRVAVAAQVGRDARGSGPRAARPAGAKWRPWLVTPCRQTSAGAPSSPHSWTGRASLGGDGERAGDELRRGGVSRRSRASRRPCRPCRSGTCRGSAAPLLLVEDAVGLRGRAVRPEVRGERVRQARASRFHACRAGGRVAGDEDDVRLRVLERVQVLLQVARLLLADGRERERVEDEQDVAAAAEVGRAARASSPSTSRSKSGASLPVSIVTRRPPRRCPTADSTAAPAAPPGR